MIVEIVRDVPLQGANRERLIDLASPAFAFAGMIAHAPADGNERIASPDHVRRLVQPAFARQREILRHIDACRTRVLAGDPDQPFADGGPTCLQDDVLDVLLAEMPQCR